MQCSPGLDQLLKRLAGDIFHYDVVAVAFLAYVIYFYDVRMREIGNGISLSLESLQIDRVIIQFSS